MYRISSSVTLLLLLMIPTLWASFFGLFTLAVWIGGADVSPIFGDSRIKWGVTTFYISGLLLLRVSLLRLKRIEIDEESIYITNFIKHVRYPHDSIKSIRINKFGLFNILNIELQAKGLFGRKIVAIQARRKFEEFVPKYPRLVEKLDLK